jgi:hypothetical protein
MVKLYHTLPEIREREGAGVKYSLVTATQLYFTLCLLAIGRRIKF